MLKNKQVFLKIFKGTFFLFFLFGFLLSGSIILAKMNYYPAQGSTNEGKLTDKGFVICYDGIVPCGKQVIYQGGATPDNWRGIGEKQCEQGQLSKGILHCQICHLFVMINGAINYLFISVIPYIVILMFVIAGVFFYLGGAKPNYKSRAKEVIKTTLIGLVLIYGSFLIVGVALTLLGVADIEPIKSVWTSNKIFQIDCLVKIPVSITE